MNKYFYRKHPTKSLPSRTLMVAQSAFSPDLFANYHHLITGNKTKERTSPYGKIARNVE